MNLEKKFYCLLMGMRYKKLIYPYSFRSYGGIDGSLIDLMYQNNE